MLRAFNALKLGYFESLALLTLSFSLLVVTLLPDWPATWLRLPVALVFTVSLGWFGYRHLWRHDKPL